MKNLALVFTGSFALTARLTHIKNAIIIHYILSKINISIITAIHTLMIVCRIIHIIRYIEMSAKRTGKIRFDDLIIALIIVYSKVGLSMVVLLKPVCSNTYMKSITQDRHKRLIFRYGNT